MANSQLKNNEATLLLTFEKVQTIDDLYHALGEARNRGYGHFKLCIDREPLAYLDLDMKHGIADLHVP